VFWTTWPVLDQAGFHYFKIMGSAVTMQHETVRQDHVYSIEIPRLLLQKQYSIQLTSQTIEYYIQSCSSRTMAYPFTRVCAFLVFLQLLCGHHGGLAANDNAKNNGKMDALALVKADNKPIESLDALRSGVFFVELAQGVRSGCGGGSSPGDQGMYEQLFIFIRIVLFILYMHLP
jgi:hypothetical protein